MAVDKEKSALYLTKCQIDTPLNIVEEMWSLVHTRKKHFPLVVDLGSGDGRFSNFGNFGRYEGFELDEERIPIQSKNPKVSFRVECAFDALPQKYDLCIGNPPYIRHHDLDNKWKQSTIKSLQEETNLRIDARSNVFTLFIMKALLCTKESGLVCQLVPYEWVSRPASKWLRDHIIEKGWKTEIFKFNHKLFSRVLTTASIVVIDKSKRSNKWDYYELNHDFEPKRYDKPTGTDHDVITHTRRSNKNYAQRGLSPGGQRVFCLTEGERLHYSLEAYKDVYPCITSMKNLPDCLQNLNRQAFKKNYIDMGRRCWLVSNDPEPSMQLRAYFDSIPKPLINNYTCRRQNPWWSYRSHNPPEILYSSGFVQKGPRLLKNHIKAIAVGAVHGIHHVDGISKNELFKALRETQFDDKIIHHSGALRKVEVNQMNTILKIIIERSSDARSRKAVC